MKCIGKNKSGFGIVEVLVSAVVLGFLLVGLLNLQDGNRDTLLRLRGRDGAVEVAQAVIDSLNRSGLKGLGNSKSDTVLHFGEVEGNDYVYQVSDAAGNKTDDEGLKKIMIRSWEGQPGTVRNTMTVKYRADITVSSDSTYMTKSYSLYDTVGHVYAKQVNVDVFWKFKGTEYSINVSGVVK